MEHVWLQLGGAACVDAAARANLDLLWKSFDNLPEGEADLLGPALDEALARLTAQPDPAADSNCGVQLMTIHKSKGLEFEIVIVPELETRPARNQPEMLSWLERGVAPEPGEFDPGVVTEFLVAPMPSKGAESGAAKRWVDRVRHNRENQEMRRLLYVAATRAREELHLFARPSYRYDENGQPALAGPGESLLATAWPAWEQEIRAQFEQWQNSAPETLETLAAAAEDNLLEMSPPARATTLRRLPADFATPRIATIAPDSPLSGAGSLFERHEGGLLSRAFGQAVHDLMLQLAQLFQSHAPHDACAVLEKFTPRMETSIRAAGIDRAQAGRLASQAIEVAQNAALDPIGQWILSPHSDAASEVCWTAVFNGRLHTVQPDRIFRAANAPPGNASSEESWWIIDYKTAHEDGADPATALLEWRNRFAAQIETYAKVLRQLHGADARVRGGLYYPRMKQFDWWDL
jgi:ATP-dependent exoDNAse (exonuclease V) beta subunit